MKNSIKQFLLVAAMVLTSTSGQAVNKVKDGESFPQILSYETLLELSPAKRESYIDGLRKMLIEMEATVQKNRDQASIEDYENFRHEFALLEMAFPSAWAQDAAPAAPTEGVIPRFENGNWTCGAAVQGVVFDHEVGTCRRTSLPLESDCGEGFEAGYIRSSALFGIRSRVTKYCIPKTSWERMSDERRQSLAQTTGAPSVRVQIYRKGDGDAANLVLGGHPPAAPTGTGPGTSPGGTQVDATRTRPGALGACAGHEIKCEGTRADRRKKFYDDASISSCIFAGNINEFMDKPKRPGRCRNSSTFRFSDHGHPYTCASARESVCNPLVFCLKKDNTPFCVPAKIDATKACDAASTADARLPDCLNQNIQGLADAWNHYREGFNQLCRNNAASRAFHCDECLIIAKRLADLNALATGDSCGEMKPYARRGDGKRDPDATTRPAPTRPAPTGGRQ